MAKMDLPLAFSKLYVSLITIFDNRIFISSFEGLHIRITCKESQRLEMTFATRLVTLLIENLAYRMLFGDITVNKAMKYSKVGI